MGKDEILNYVMNSPENTNRAVLSGMLDEINSDGGDSNDFSTATVTFLNTASSGGYDVFAGTCTDDGFTITHHMATIDSPAQFLIPLYKGSAFFPLSTMINAQQLQEELPTTSGGVSLDMQTGNLIIIGDGTFAAKGNEGISS